MKRRWLSILVLLGACSVEPAPDLRDELTPQVAGMKLVFSDEFSGNKLNRAKWNTSYHFWSQSDGGSTNEGNRELQWYLPGNVSVANGAAQLTARKRSYRAPTGKRYAYTSGILSSHHKFQFTYGYIEARMRIPQGRGLWPAFWTLPIPGAVPQSKPEIDIMEVLGQEPKTVHFNLHYLNAAGQHRQAKRRYTGSKNLAQGWHTYAVRWEPGRLIYYLNGVERHRVEGAMVPSKKMYLLLNLAVGGEWPGAPNQATPFPSSLEVDYVRVYKRR